MSWLATLDSYFCVLLVWVSLLYSGFLSRSHLWAYRVGGGPQWILQSCCHLVRSLEVSQAASHVTFLLLYLSCLSHSLVIMTKSIFFPHWKSNTHWISVWRNNSLLKGVLCFPLTSDFLLFPWAQKRSDIYKPAKGSTGGFGNTGVDWTLQFLCGVGELLRDYTA